MIIKLQHGWNIVSFPVKDLNLIIKYNEINKIESNSNSLTWTRDSFFNDLDSIDINIGYYVYVTKDINIELPDITSNKINYQISSGWNLISWYIDILSYGFKLSSNAIV